VDEIQIFWDITPFFSKQLPGFEGAYCLSIQPPNKPNRNRKKLFME
jgi:hypothetical protein